MANTRAAIFMAIILAAVAPRSVEANLCVGGSHNAAGCITNDDCGGGVCTPLRQLPLRWCALRGSLTAENPASQGEPTTSLALWRRHERPSDRIYIPQTGVTFRSALWSLAVGDVFPKVPFGNNSGVITLSQVQDVVTACDRAWTDNLVPQFNSQCNDRPPPCMRGLPGVPAIVVKKITNAACPNCFNGGFGAWTPGDPDNDPTSVTPRYLIVVDQSTIAETVGDPSCNEVSPQSGSIPGHELGHTLGLDHVIDASPAPQRNLMAQCDPCGLFLADGPVQEVNLAKGSCSTAQSNKRMLANQRQWVRDVARMGKWPGAADDPVAALIPGAFQSFLRVDALHDVPPDEGIVDISAVTVGENSATGETDFTFRLIGFLDTPGSGVLDYWVLVDVDKDPTSGAPPAVLPVDVPPTSFAGTELLALIRVTRTEVGPQLKGHVFKFVNGRFVEFQEDEFNFLTVRSERDLADIGESFFQYLSLTFPTRFRGPIGAVFRFQAMTHDLTTDVVDRLDDSDVGFFGSLVPAEFPLCAVMPPQARPGASVSMQVTGHRPNQELHVLVGDTEVATGLTDGSGAATIPFNVPVDSREGTRLVTVGSIDMALTADCTIDVQGPPVPQPPTIMCPLPVTTECASPSGTVVSLTAQVSDPDGDALTVTWQVNGATVQVDNVPASGPPTSASVTMMRGYALGPHAVQVTVSDGTTPSASCSTTVTIEDTRPPAVHCSVTLPVLSTPFPPNHRLVNVGLNVAAEDRCEGEVPTTVAVFGDEDDEAPTGDGVFSPDARDIAGGTLRLRDERKGDSNGRVYLILGSATDSSNNTGFDCCTEAVPLSISAASITSINAQTKAARDFCVANGGAPPPDYFVIGDGPVIGPKQ